MKKAVPLSVILASSVVLGQDYLSSSQWTLKPSPNPSTSTANCCYYSGPVAIDSATSPLATGQVATGTTAPAGCSDYTAAPSAVAASGGNEVWTNTLTLATGGASALTGTTAVGVGAASVGFAVTDNGLTLTVTPSAKTGATAGTTCSQTFARTTAAVTGLDGTWTAGAGTAGSGTSSGACCFLDTATPVVVATSGTQTTVTAKTGTCTTGGNAAVTKILKAGSTTGTARDLSGVNLFTVNSDGTVQYSPTGQTTGTNACTQTLTKSSSSGIHLASVMTPVVVGGAMLGFVAV